MADLHLDPRAHRAEQRLRPWVLGAAVAVLPLVALSLSHPKGVWHDIEVAGHALVWLVFAVEIAVMLRVVADWRGWLAGHRFEVLVVIVSSPLVPLALAVLPAVRVLTLVKSAKAAKLIKLAKLRKSVVIVRRRAALNPVASRALVGVSVALALATIAYLLFGTGVLSHGPGRALALALCGGLLVIAVGGWHLPHDDRRTRNAQRRQAVRARLPQRQKQPSTSQSS